MSETGQSETQVGIVGAGPAGLLLSHLLHRHGIDSVVLERHSRDYVEERVRAGVLEQNTVDLLTDCGVGERLQKEGLPHHGIELLFNRQGHRLPLSECTDGRFITIYGQREVVKDLIDTRLEAGGKVHFEAEVTEVKGVDEERPWLIYRQNGEERRLDCRFIAGCDGYHGVTRPSFPAGSLTVYERSYPYGWLGILAQTPPSSDELIYANSDRGFALSSMRSPTLSRLYVQCDADDTVGDWPDARVWEELHARLARESEWTLEEGPVEEKTLAQMHSFVVEPMQYKRVFLAGDAAHIVPPTGAKGLNLAVGDIWCLFEALEDWFAHNRNDLLNRYSTRCLERVWRAQQFTSWMTTLLHNSPDDDAFEYRLRHARLDYIFASPSAMRSLAENYAGIPYR